jgi:hypothetical protein
VVIVSSVLESVINRKVMVILQGLKAYFDQNTLIDPSTSEGITSIHCSSLICRITTVKNPDQ